MFINQIMKKLQGSFKNFLWLSVEKVILLIIEMLVLTQIARTLGVESFGVFSYILTLVFFLSPFTVFGLSGILNRYCIEPKGYNVTQIMSTAISLKLLVVFFTLIFFALTLYFLSVDDDILFYAILLSFAEVFRCFQCVGRWFDSQLLSKWNGIAKVINTVIFSIAKLYGIYTQKDFDFFIIIIFIEVIVHSIILGLLFKYISKVSLALGGVDGRLFKELFRIGLPLLISSFGAIIYLKSDIFIVDYFLGKESVGLYSAATQFVEVFYAIPIMIGVSIFPMVMKSHKNGNLLLFSEKVIFYFFILGCIVSTVLYIMSDYIVLTLYGAAFNSSITILSIYCFSLPIVFIRGYLSRWIVATESYYLSLYTQLGGAIVNVILNIIFIPKYGLSGAAWATIFSMFIASTLPLFIYKDSRSMGIIMIFPIKQLFNRKAK